MPTSLTDQTISVTYKGLLHSQGVALPTADRVRIYDGQGNKASFAVGRDSAGMTVYGSLSSDILVSQTAVITNSVVAPNTAKVWVNFSGSSINGDQTINSRYNVTNVSRSGVGLSQVYAVNFSGGALANAKYTYNLTFGNSKVTTDYIAFAFVDTDNPPTTSYINLCFRKFNGTAVVPFDPPYVSLTIFNN